MLLDLSAAFNTVDHDKLKHHLEQEFGVTDGALQWLNSYLQNRQQAILVRGVESSERTLAYGASTGICAWATIIRKDYITQLASLIQSFDINFHGYADDTQLYAAFEPTVTEDKMV